MSLVTRTVADLIAEMERLRPTIKESREDFVKFVTYERLAARAMAREGIQAVERGSDVYVRYNDSLERYEKVPNAVTVKVDRITVGGVTR